MILVELFAWLVWMIAATLAAPLGVRHVGTYLGSKEYYGGSCEMRVFQLQVGDTWFETQPVWCPPPRRPFTR